MSEQIQPIPGDSALQVSHDASLARRCAQGDESALREAFEAHEPRLRGLAFRVLGNQEDAEEVAAGALLKFWKSAGRYRGECSLRTYLTRIALNIARDTLRRRPKSLAVGAADAEPSEMMERIRDGMARLGEEDREVLALYYLEDTTYEEICEVLGVSYDVLRTRLVRARRRLRQAVGAGDD